MPTFRLRRLIGDAPATAAFGIPGIPGIPFAGPQPRAVPGRPRIGPGDCGIAAVAGSTAAVPARRGRA